MTYYIILFILLLYIILIRSDDDVKYESKRVFLDHGGLFIHNEVFYPVAVLITERVFPTSNITFVIEKQYAERTGLLDFWEKHAEEGVLGECISQ